MHQRAIFFLHNPKAGGSSLQKAFRALFSAEEIAPVFSNAPNDHRANKSSISRHRDYAFYAGHYGHDAFKELSTDHVLVTNFRDPVARIISIYRYWRNNVSAEDVAGAHPRDAAVVMYSHELDFASFIRCEDPDLLLYISNFHFRQLLDSPWESSTIRPWHRLKVKRRISGMPWFYVAEMPEVSTMLLSRSFPELRASELPCDNISRGERIAITSADVEHLVSLNRLDYDIYHHALREQHGRFS